MENQELKSKYSEAESKIFKALDLDWWNTVENSWIQEPVAYRILVEKVFCQNLTGPAVEALRRAYNAITSSKPYRMTEEFDNLCEFEEV